MISLEINGVKFVDFLEYEVSQSIEDVSGSFSFTAASDGKKALPFPVGSSCRVLIDNTPIITGYVEVIQAQYDSSRHIISVSGRDKTADIIDSTIGGNVDFTGKTELKELVEYILEKSQLLYNFEVFQPGIVTDPFTESEIKSPETGDSVFSAIETLCRKRQILITANGDGNIVLTRGSTTVSTLSLYNNPNTPGLNNIKSASVTYDNSNRYNQYVVRSQNNTSSANFLGTQSASTATNARGRAFDEAINREGRILNIVAEHASDSDQCEKRAIWQANINRARSLVYNPVVVGHTDRDGTPWEINKLVKVDDIYSGLVGLYLINSVLYRLTADGTETELSIVPFDAYTIEPEAPVEQSESSVSLGFSLP